MRIALLSFVLVAGLLAGCADEVNPRAADHLESPTPKQDGQPFRLQTHCGLSVPLEFEKRLWLPVNARFRDTHNPPEGFGGDENYDEGTMRRVDSDTIIYTSSGGVEVEYEPTKRRPGHCE